MSRIGKKAIKIPQGVEVQVEGTVVKAKGPKGELEREFSPLLDIKVSEGSVLIGLKEPGATTKQASEVWGLTRALLANMIHGVHEGFEKVLEFSGIGFKAQTKDGSSLDLGLGFSHPVVIKAPEGVLFQVEKNTIKITGIDKEKIGHIAAKIRDLRPPEPYKGSGIKYRGEFIRRKAGKKAVATSG